jgi:cell division topological specificity factor
MSPFRFFKSRRTAPVARERLQILLAHERVALGPRDLVAILRDELLATIARHIEIDPEKLSVKMDRSDALLDAGDRCGNSMRKDQLGVFSLRPTTDASAA